MVSTFTPNINLEEPARGDDVGTWDTPVNSNMTLLDLTLGGITTISLNNSNIVLSAAQFLSKGITTNSTLTGSVTITFPTSFTKSYEFFNQCTGSLNNTVTLATTAGGQVICAGRVSEICLELRVDQLAGVHNGRRGREARQRLEVVSPRARPCRKTGQCQFLKFK
jgi:hypothetical protein